MTYCTSCGLPIPDGQGRSCSMCYGDPWYGKDGYALRELEYRLEMEYMEEPEDYSSSEISDDLKINFE
ncbi:MAG TPA: hypothetical protein PLC59_02655 [Bacteroidales bacterium]|nr:hypothetical protein [Bacteroidales bacterium]HQI44955.1 hypothetical protein [Bacteroidales bacterium]